MTETTDKKIALVTGAGRGIGKSIAELLASKGHHVICVSRSAGSCGAVADAINASGGSAQSLAVDVADNAAVLAASEQLLKEHGNIDILVNNAGIGRERMVFNMDEEEWDDVINIHLKGTFATTKFASALMRKQKSGRIINTTSGAGLRGATGQSNYAAAKAGICGFTISVAMELSKYNITSNVIIPAARTRMTESISDKAKKIREKSGLYKASAIPIPEAETVGPLIVFLAADESQDISGQIVAIRGEEISLWSHHTKERYAFMSGGWSYEQLQERFRTTVGTGLNLTYARGTM
jgi:3-oxoacyl-[acyl-carrier protein] reductase